MTNSKLKADLLARLKVTPQALSSRVQTLKGRWPMTTADATYCIAHQEGLKLDKYLPQETVDRVRGLLPHVSTDNGGAAHSRAKVRTVTRTRDLTIGGEISISDPLLPERVLEEARRMAGRVYPMLYLFENSVREVIQRMMRKRFGVGWWVEANIPTEIRAQVRQRQRQEDDRAWHGKRGAHPIYYTNIDDLSRIVQNNWPLFRGVFDRQDWFAQLVRCVEVSRNTVAHMNPLAKDDFDRLRINLSDWQKQVSAKKSLLVGLPEAPPNE